jgi:uncharacterized membrane protein
MHPNWATYLRVLLALHILCGAVAFVCAPVALSTAKGGKTHRRFGKIYFWAMAGVAVTALVLSFALPIFFLAMVAVFSFYSAFAAYRVLFLKDMYTGARPKPVDWLAAVVTILSSFLLFLMGFLKPELMGVGVIQVAGHAVSIVSVVFGIIGMRMGPGFDCGISQTAHGKNVLVVWPHAGNDGQLHRSPDGVLGGESYALVWRRVVGMALANHGRRARDLGLDDILQKEVFTKGEGRRYLNSAWS